MKFAQYLEHEAVPEWREKYIDYDKLKSLLQEAAKLVKERQLRGGAMRKPSGSVPQSPTTGSGPTSPQRATRKRNEQEEDEDEDEDQDGNEAVEMTQRRGSLGSPDKAKAKAKGKDKDKDQDQDQDTTPVVIDITAHHEGDLGSGSGSGSGANATDQEVQRSSRQSTAPEIEEEDGSLLKGRSQSVDHVHHDQEDLERSTPESFVAKLRAKVRSVSPKIDRLLGNDEEDLEEEHLPEIAREAAGGDHTGLRDRFKREGSDILKRLKKTPVGTLWEEIKPLDTTGAKEPEVYDLPPILVTAPSFHFSFVPFVFSFHFFVVVLFFVFRVVVSPYSFCNRRNLATTCFPPRAGSSLRV